MKKVFGVSVLFAIILGFAASAFAEMEKVGYVDVAKVFDSYLKTKDNDRVLQQAGKKKEEERDSLVKDIRAAKDELALLNDDAKAKKQESLALKVKDLENFDVNTRKTLGEQRNKVVREIFKDIDAAIQKYGTTNQLDMIFNERALLFHSAKMDGTQAVIDALNKEYSGKKK